MAWFERKKKGILTDRSGQNDIPEGHWIKCPGCAEIVNRRELLDSLRVCPKCGFHMRMGSTGYFHLLFDNATFEVHDRHLRSKDPLDFYDRRPYQQRLHEAIQKTGLHEAAQAATGPIGGYQTSVAALDFSFIGGSMASVVGETVARAVRRAYTGGMPLIVISQSGGARMMEGALSLMQMAKTSAHLTRLAEQGLPYISVLTHPTTGGVTASFAMLGDIHIAEPGALIGFAGPRVIRETIGQDLPDDFQSAEFLQKHGFVDLIVDRRQLRKQIVHLLGLMLETA